MSPFTLLDDATRHVTVLYEQRPLAVYRYARDQFKPYFHPLYTLSGHVLTGDRPHDHDFHHGLFFGWTKVNGYDFWGESFADPGKRGVIKHIRFIDLLPKADSALIVEENEWRVPGNGVLLTEIRRFGFCVIDDDNWMIDIEQQLNVPQEGLYFDTPPAYQGLCFRAARSMAAGEISNANGDRGVEETDGTPAQWCDYTGALDDGGGAAGVTIIDHPGNCRHPTFFFTKSKPFGFIAAAPAYHEPLSVMPGETSVWRYRVVVHLGEPKRQLLQQLYETQVN